MNIIFIISKDKEWVEESREFGFVFVLILVSGELDQMLTVASTLNYVRIALWIKMLYREHILVVILITPCSSVSVRNLLLTA